MKLRKKISTTVQILSHIKEKLAFVQQQRTQAEQILEGKEKEVKQVRMPRLRVDCVEHRCFVSETGRTRYHQTTSRSFETRESIVETKLGPDR